jgi:hypothetical protein
MNILNEIVSRPPKIPSKNVSVNSQPKPARSTSINDFPQSRERVPAGRGKGITGSTSISTNVFATRSIVKRRPTLLENSADPTKQTKHYRNMHVVRKAELAGRDKDVAPDITALGGLFKPGEIPKMYPVTASDVRRPPVDMFERRDSRHDQRNVVESSGSGHPAKTAILPGTGKTICYFWNLNKGADYACSKGINCTYLHENVPGATLADPPPKLFDGVQQKSSETASSTSLGGQQPDLHRPMDGIGRSDNRTLNHHDISEESTRGTYSAVCWYWYKDGKCVKSSRCDYLHTNDPRYPITKRPITDRSFEESQPRRCPFWVKHNYCKHMDNCNYLHSTDSSIPVAKTAEICVFWERGTCMYSANDCAYLHGEPPSTKAPNRGDFQVRISDDNMNNPAIPSGRKPITSGTEQRTAPEKSVSFGPTESTTFFEPEIRRDDPLISFEAPEVMAIPPKLLKKVSMDDYKLKGAQKALKDRTKLLSFGGGTNQRPVPLDVGEMGPDTNWRRAFAAIRDIRLDLQCSHDDISTQFQIGRHRIVWEGSLMPVNAEDPAASTVVENIATHMKLLCCGMLASLPDFNLLVFPNRAEEWNFLPGTSFPEEVKLRYILFYSDFDISSCNYFQTNVPPVTTNPKRESYTKTLVEEVHGLSIDRLGTHGKNGSPLNFYLMFPTYAKKTCLFVAKFLGATFPKCKLFNGDVDGSWKSFAGLPSGTVIIHASMVDELDELPYLNTILRSHSRVINLFYATDSSIESCMFPSLSSPLYTYNRYLGAGKTDNSALGKVVVERLFPHGGIIFLTPSFLAAEPGRTYEILYWFFGRLPGMGKFETATTGTWKLATCWNFLGYMHDLAIAKSEERDRFLIENQDNDAKDAKAAERGLGYESCLMRFKIHAFLTEVFARGGVLNTVPQGISFYTENTLDQCKEPVVYFGHPWTGVDVDNEAKLSEMFAGWAFSRMDSFRRFILLGTGPKSVFKARRLKSVPPGTGFVRQAGMTPQKQKALAIAARIGQSPVNGSIISKHGSSEHESKLRDFSRSSTSSEDKLNIDAQILQLIESSRPPDSPLRIVTSGITNGPCAPTSSTGSAYTRTGFSPALSLGTDAGSRIVSTAASPVRPVPALDTPMYNSPGSATPIVHDHDIEMVDVDATPAGDENPEEPTTEYEMVQFEDTKTWYERAKTARGGLMWEHLAVIPAEDWHYLAKWVGLKH